jgi:uncharacterized protein YecE (DUF72 family)
VATATDTDVVATGSTSRMTLHAGRTRLRVGCAGWSILSRHARYFPREGSHLQRYAAVFEAVEINSSFYRPHRAETWATWGNAVPAAFRFAVKMPRDFSHDARLSVPVHALRDFLEPVRELGDRLGPLLLQLPASVPFERRTALRFLDRLRTLHAGAVVVEPRHASWFTAKVGAELVARGIGRVAADPARVPRAAVPGGHHRYEYARLHGSPRMYYDEYPAAALARLVRRALHPDPRVDERWLMFDNTAHGHALLDALVTRNALRQLTGS